MSLQKLFKKALSTMKIYQSPQMHCNVHRGLRVEFLVLARKSYGKYLQPNPDALITLLWLMR